MNFIILNIILASAFAFGNPERAAQTSPSTRTCGDGSEIPIGMPCLKASQPIPVNCTKRSSKRVDYMVEKLNEITRQLIGVTCDHNKRLKPKDRKAILDPATLDLALEKLVKDIKKLEPIATKCQHDFSAPTAAELRSWVNEIDDATYPGGQIRYDGTGLKDYLTVALSQEKIRCNGWRVESNNGIVRIYDSFENQEQLETEIRDSFEEYIRTELEGVNAQQ